METGPDRRRNSAADRAENRDVPAGWDWLSRIETWLEPLSATTRSGRVAGEVGHGDPNRVGADEVAMPAVDRRPELAVAQARVNQHVVAAAVGDDQVGDAVAVKSASWTAPGSSRPVD